MTQIVSDHLIEWSVGTKDSPPFGHTYGGIFDSVSPTETDVTNYCDWSGASEEFRSAMTWPVVPDAMLEKSVENLDRVATESLRAITSNVARKFCTSCINQSARPAADPAGVGEEIVPRHLRGSLCGGRAWAASNSVSAHCPRPALWAARTRSRRPSGVRRSALLRYGSTM